jgi:hypothetical protein
MVWRVCIICKIKGTLLHTTQTANHLLKTKCISPWSVAHRTSKTVGIPARSFAVGIPARCKG